jgi:ATP-dependent Zn protease
MSKGFFGWVLFIAVAVMLFMLLNKTGSSYATIPMSDFVARLESGAVRTVTVGNDEVSGEFRNVEIIDGDKVGKFHVALPAGTTSNWVFTKWLVDNRHDARVDTENSPNLLMNILIPLIPWLLIFGFIWFFVFRQLRSQQKTKVGEALKVYVVNQPGEPPPDDQGITPPPR